MRISRWKGSDIWNWKRIVFTQLRVDGVLNHPAFLRGSLSICGERRTCYSVDEIWPCGPWFKSDFWSLVAFDCWACLLEHCLEFCSQQEKAYFGNYIEYCSPKITESTKYRSISHECLRTYIGLRGSQWNEGWNPAQQTPAASQRWRRSWMDIIIVLFQDDKKDSFHADKLH